MFVFMFFVDTILTFRFLPFVSFFLLSKVFWNRLSNAYGTIFYVRDNGIDLAITNAIEAIVTCLRSEDQFCVNVPDTAPSMRSLGLS